MFLREAISYVDILRGSEFIRFLTRFTQFTRSKIYVKIRQTARDEKLQS